MTDKTQDQIASIMLQHGTPKQQKEALEYCKIDSIKPTCKWCGSIEIYHIFECHTCNMIHRQVALNPRAALKIALAILGITL